MDGDLIGEAVDDLLFHVQGFPEAGGPGVSEGLDVTFLLCESGDGRGVRRGIGGEGRGRGMF